MPPKKSTKPKSVKVAKKPSSKLSKELEEMERQPRREEFEEDLVFEDPGLLDDDSTEPPAKLNSAELPLQGGNKVEPGHVGKEKEQTDSSAAEKKTAKKPKSTKKPRRTASKKPFASLTPATDKLAALSEAPSSVQDPREITKLIRLALAEEFKQREEVKEKERKIKQAERDVKRKAFIEKKQADKAAREAERKKEKQEEHEKLHRLILQREADLNRHYATTVGRVRQRLVM